MGKTKVVIFRMKIGKKYDFDFILDGRKLEMVAEHKYVGIILRCTLDESRELQRILSSFNRSVGMFPRRFATVDFTVKGNLFVSFCESIFGLDPITNTKGCQTVLMKSAVSYHFAFKR